MIDDKTIKSLYDDKPTLLEWLKRVEAQLEELKKITNFDTLTANNVEVKEDMDVGGILRGNEANFDTLTANNVEVKEDMDVGGILRGNEANFQGASIQDGLDVKGDFNVNNKSVCRNIYVHRITWEHVPTKSSVCLYYLSINPLEYGSMSDIFSHKNDTNLSYSEVAEFMGDSAIIRFGPTGTIISCVQITGTGGEAAMTAITAYLLSFKKDEVIGGWGV